MRNAETVDAWAMTRFVYGETWLRREEAHSMPKKEVRVDGHCYCGSISFEVRIPAGERPYFSLYCHCDSCRRAHASPLFHVVCVGGDMLKITQGEKLLRHYRQPGGNICRSFCNRCGTRVLNRFGSFDVPGEPVAFFPNLLRSEFQDNLPSALRPTHNKSLESCVLDGKLLEPLQGGGPALDSVLSQAG